MEHNLIALSATAVTIGVTHTLLGPDHYLPFVALARSRKWSVYRTGIITALCGLGHVLGSIILGAVGLLAGIMVGRLESFEAVRGDWAAALLIIFGTIYMFWGLWRFFYPKEHKHVLLHKAGIEHDHLHSHQQLDDRLKEEGKEDHHHGNVTKHDGAGVDTTPWVMFIIFVLGPCEPLIPLLMYPASEKNFTGAMLVALIFGVATVSTMLVIVLSLYAGLKKIKLGIFERLSHFIAGLAITLCGIAILFLGL